MKIAMIGQKGIPSRAGGIEVHVGEISKRLVKLGCNVEVYCRKGYCDKDQSEYEGIRLQYVPFIQSKHFDAITHTFFSTIKALFTQCDIFHYHALGPATLSFIPRILRKKVVCTVHGLDWKRGKWGRFASLYLKFGEYATAKFSHATINVSSNLVDYYKNKYHKKTVYIPNGIEKTKLAIPEIIKNKYGLEKDGYILFLARLVPEKGAHYLLQAYKKIDTEKKLVIAGGTSYSDRYVKELRALAEDDNRILFTGFVQEKELCELYSNAYLYVLPSDIEGLPISLLEAMSYGNCCLTSDIEENSNIIDRWGYLFQKGNISDLAQKIKYLIKAEEEVKFIRKNVQGYVLKKYNWDNIAYDALAVYKNIIQGRTYGKKNII